MHRLALTAQRGTPRRPRIARGRRPGILLAALCLPLAASCAVHPASRPAPRLAPLISPQPQPTPASGCHPYQRNPWGYDFCAGDLILSPPAEFCRYLKCERGFARLLKGYVVQCRSGDFSRAGGYPGACGFHGGIWRVLYSPAGKVPLPDHHRPPASTPERR